MWDIVKNATKPTRNLVENVVLKDNDRDVNDLATVASLFNQYFSRIAVDLTKGFQPQNSTSDSFPKSFRHYVRFRNLFL